MEAMYVSTLFAWLSLNTMQRWLVYEGSKARSFDKSSIVRVPSSQLGMYIFEAIVLLTADICKLTKLSYNWIAVSASVKLSRSSGDSGYRC